MLPVCKATAVRVQAPQRRAVAVQVSRRDVCASLLFVGLVAAPAAVAKDLKQAQAEKEARRKKLRDIATKDKETGKDMQVFEPSNYSLQELLPKGTGKS